MSSLPQYARLTTGTHDDPRQDVVNMIVIASDLEGGGGTTAWADITGKPAVIGAGADAGAARTAIGAGTSSLAVATTAAAALAAAAAVGTGTTAARADHVHPFPTAANVGAAPTSHTHVGTAVTLTGYTIGTAGAVAAADTLNAAIAKLEARIVALETT